MARVGKRAGLIYNSDINCQTIIAVKLYLDTNFTNLIECGHFTGKKE